jgi:hypothetical protein
MHEQLEAINKPPIIRARLDRRAQQRKHRRPKPG